MAKPPFSPIHGMGTTQPLSHYEYTLSDTVALLPGTIAIRLSVTVAGNLVIVDWGDTAVTYHFAVGNHLLPAQFIKRINSTSATATLSPATKVQCWLQG